MNKLLTLNSESRLLMGAGPSQVWPNVLQALAKPPIGHLDADFNDIMEECKSLLRYVFQTNNAMTFPVSGTGSGAMELCFMNLIEPGDAILICENGVFSSRMKAIAEKLEAEIYVLKQSWGEAVDIGALEKLLQHNPQIKLVCAVHGETSTGVLSDAEAIAKISKKYGCLTLIDAVTSLIGTPFYMDQWGIDIVYSGTQKCLSCVPGLSMVSFSDEAMTKIKQRKTVVKSWYFDINLISQYWFESSGKSRSYHHTAPVNMIFALYQALFNISELTLEVSWSHHQEASDYLMESFTPLGLMLAVPKAIAMPQLNIFKIPSEIQDVAFRMALLKQFDIEVSGGLGEYAGKMWRVGLMGASANKQSVDQLVNAFKQLLG